MRKVNIFIDKECAGQLQEIDKEKEYRVSYREGYIGFPAPLTMPVNKTEYVLINFCLFLRASFLKKLCLKLT